MLNAHDLRQMNRGELEELLERIMLRLRQLDAQVIQREIAAKSQRLNFRVASKN